MKGRRALVLQHEQPTPGGYVNQWLEERGADQHVFRIDIDDSEVNPRDYDLIVSLGSEFAAFDDVPWIKREEVMLREAAAAEVPILGVCFGGQLLAKALGGNAFRSDKSEIGWLPVRTRDESLVPTGPWFQWHFDSFTLPSGASLIADTDVGPQAFIKGRSLGTQFHPEVTPEIMQSWVKAYAHELEHDGIDPKDLLDETNARATDTRAAAWRLFDAFIDRVARPAREAVRGR
ncbi:MAG TPA: type 1 glutamine amidotransferase [Thermoleophilaceae bacterium]|nr:type 1 glutamine amidotransferase [Thermoleophilaceae bacterium]